MKSKFYFFGIVLAFVILNEASAQCLFPGTIGNNQVICDGGNPSPFISIYNAFGSKIGGTITYQWQYSNNGTGSWINISGATSNTYDAPSGLSIDRWYRRRASNSCATLYSNSIFVEVNDLAPGSISGAQTICSGGNPSVLTSDTTASDSVGLVSYQWQYSNNGSSGWTNISGTTGLSYDPPSGLSSTRWYRRRATDNCKSTYSNSVKVTVNSGCRLEKESVSAKEVTQFAVYPNPLNNYQLLTITVPEHFKNGVIEIFEMSGKKVYSQTLSNQNMLELNLNVGKGIYSVQLKSEVELLKTIIIKEN